jgi:transcriptional regulator with XRE-family HTH domain
MGSTELACHVMAIRPLSRDDAIRSFMDSRATDKAAGNRSGLEVTAGARLREIRLISNMSLSEVAKQADVSKGFLSQLERGLSNVSVPTLLRICDVLKVGVGDLFAYPDERPPTGGTRIDMGGDGVTEYLLSPADSTAFQVFRSLIEPGGGTGGPYRLDETVIFALGVRGTTRVVVAGEDRTLSPGMSTTFSGDDLHQFDNPGTTVSEVLWVLSPPLRQVVRRSS